MREPYQIDLFDLDDRPWQPVPSGNPFQVARFYRCPKCGETVGMYMREGKDKGWHDVKDECRNGHKMNWEGVQE